MSVKKRRNPVGPRQVGTKIENPTPPFNVKTPAIWNNTNTFDKYEELSSIGHKASRDGKYREGGAFYVLKSECKQVPTYWKYSSPSGRYYEGELYAISTATASSSLPILPSSSTLNALGSTGIAKATPTNPKAGLGQFIGELREGLPTIPGLRRLQDRHRSFLSRTGNEFLNIQFGWLPLLHDIRSFIHNVRNYDAIAKQLARDSGKPVRRRVPVITNDKTTSLVTSTVNSIFSPALVSQFYNSTVAERNVLTTSTVNATFAGCFTYYLPPPGQDLDVFGRDSRQRALDRIIFGFELTPRLVWNLLPYSWLADWVGNIGDVVNNWTNFQHDGLVMKYGYLMYHKVDQVSTSLTCKMADGQSLTASYLDIKEVKARQVATPYGFGLNPNTFSARQLAILAALGLSKSG